GDNGAAHHSPLPVQGTMVTRPRSSVGQSRSFLNSVSRRFESCRGYHPRQGQDRFQRPPRAQKALVDQSVGEPMALPVEAITQVLPLLTATRSALPSPLTSPARVVLDP